MRSNGDFKNKQNSESYREPLRSAVSGSRLVQRLIFKNKSHSVKSFTLV